MPQEKLHIDTLTIERIAEGDQQAFATFYHCYYPQLRPFLQKYTPSAAEADEVIQQTFLRVWIHRDKLPEIENIPGWLYRITAREYLRQVRSKLRLREKILLPGEISHPDTTGKPTSDDPLSVRELHLLIQQAVQTLSPQRREVFQLSRGQQLGIQEIADQLELAPKTVKNTLTAALTQIRAYLRQHGYSLGILALLKLLY
ncbi:MAG: sigma-70 family RNA polymerase sigma factor [Candidatus Pseudobacter hemicellulosilyticus]|uniref:Sigma-70 family RNA polymerase sigma factor n=1 Tax=Candidatus Pseudobacter hemicellulosilyticus TaxID=3121375 RepID=A0AAJ5WZ39_9BACT|nr:MAG: sigma-70 family RNA polymerase sigma factor [Pseudobacter sp.]